MKQSGRDSATSLLMAPTAIDNRPAAPACLTEYEAGVWNKIVDTKPADWFSPDSHQLLISLCKHMSTAAVLDKEIDNFNPAGLADKEGLDRYKALSEMRVKQTNAIAMLSRSMRLTQQAKYDTQKASRASRPEGKKPWEFQKK